jgi:hypothetical protein
MYDEDMLTASRQISPSGLGPAVGIGGACLALARGVLWGLIQACDQWDGA